MSKIFLFLVLLSATHILMCNSHIALTRDFESSEENVLPTPVKIERGRNIKIQTITSAPIDKRCNLNEKCTPYYKCRKELTGTSEDSLFLPSDYWEHFETCMALEICCDLEKVTSEIPADVPPSKCGFHNQDGLGPALKSHKAGFLEYTKYAEFPWMVAVLKINESDSHVSILRSGGSLIHPKVVLTSAHNIAGIDANELKVRAGEWEIQTQNELYKQEERRVASVINHEHFTRKNLQNDVAMLVLEKEFPMTAAINTICLPPPNSDFSGQRCFMSGWGRSVVGDRPTFLKKIQLPVINETLCQNQFRKTRFGPDFLLHEGFLCAGGEEGKDACIGDGGSPLVCSIPSNPGSFYLAGIVAGGIGCGHQNFPGLFASVSNYRGWVDQKMQELALDKVSYEF